MEVRGRHFKWHMCSMEFHGMFHGIPWNSVPPNEISLSSVEFHGTLILSFSSIPCYPELSWDIPWNSMGLWSRQIKNPTEFQVISWNTEGAISNDTVVPWNSMAYSMEFHRTLVPPNEIWLSSMEYSMEFHGTLVLPNEISLSSMEFHGTLVPPNEISLSSKEFHGTLRLSF